MLHLEPHVEDVVGGGEGRARGELCEGNDRAVVEAVGRATFAVGQEHGVADRQGCRLLEPHLLDDDVAVAVGAHARGKGLSHTEVRDVEGARNRVGRRANPEGDCLLCGTAYRVGSRHHHL